MDITSILLQIFSTLVVGYVVISFFERWIHRNIMHRDKYLRLFCKPTDNLYKFIYVAHALAHHGWYYKKFDYEPDEYGRFCNLRLYLWHGVAIGLPLWLGLFFLSPVCGVTFLLLIFIHTLLWNAIHVEMHVPSGSFFSHWPIFRFLSRYHFMHHRYPGKNFNIVFPLADYILGSYMKVTERDIALMQEIDLAPGQDQSMISSRPYSSQSSDSF